MEPPYMAPQYTPPIRTSPVSGSSENVTGINRATAMVAVKPGIPPTTIPENVPIRTAISTDGVARDISASTIM